MSNAILFAFKLIIIAECFVISAGNIFTILVFWKNRKKLKRTSFLLINLAVADLMVGFLTPIAVEAFESKYQQLEEASINNTVRVESKEIVGVFQAAFSFGSVFFLALIALERVYAVIWPLRHRVASTKSYVYSVLFVWVAALAVGGLSLQASYNILNLAHWIVAYNVIVILALTVVSVSYLAIRTKLNCRVPAIDEAHNKKTVFNQSKKLSRTLFLVIAASLVFWFPSSVVYSVHYLCSKCVPLLLLFISNILHVANSLINPIIYSFRISMFKDTLKRMKFRKKSKQYRVHYRS